MDAKVFSARYSTTITIHRCKQDDADVLMIELPKTPLDGCVIPNLYMLSVNRFSYKYSAVYTTPVVKLFVERLKCDRTELSADVEYTIKADERGCIADVRVPGVLKLKYEVTQDHSPHSAVVASITILDIHVGDRVGSAAR